MLPRANYVKPHSAIRQRPYKKVEELRSERSVDGIHDLIKLPPSRQSVESRDKDRRYDGKENRRPTPGDASLLKNVGEGVMRSINPIYGGSGVTNKAVDRYYNNRERDILNK